MYKYSRTYKNSNRQRMSFVALLVALVMMLTTVSSALAAVEFGSSITVTADEVSNTLTIVLPNPAVATGDLLMVQISASRNSTMVDIPNPVAPPDWQTLSIVHSDSPTSPNLRLLQAIYYKVIASPGSEPTEYTWTIDGSGAGAGDIYSAAAISRYTGVDSANPIGTAAHTPASGIDLTAPDITVEANSRAVAYFTRKSNVTLIGPADVDVRYSITNSHASGPGILLADRLIPVAGPAGIVVSDNITGSGRWIASQVELRAAAATALTVSMTSSASDPTNTSPIPVTVQFSDNVADFTIDDIVATNGTVSNFTGSNSTYTFDLTPSAQGLVSADIPAGVATIGGTIGNTAATFSRTYDNVAPAVTLSSSETSPTNGPTIPMTAQFSEGVSGLLLDEIVMGNGTASNLVAVDADTYTFVVTPATDGVVTVDIPVNVANNAAGNGNTASAQFSIVYDATSPTVSMTSAAANPTTVSPVPVTVQFSENVTGFAAEDIVAANGTVGNFVAVDGDTYTFSLSPSTQGTVTANIAANVASDAAGNGNNAATEFSRVFDAIGASVTINQASGQADPTNVSPVLFTVVFAEPVSGFDSADVVLSGTAGATTAVVTELAPNNGTTYQVAVSGMVANGTISAAVNAGGAVDAFGNGNAASSSTDNTVTFVLNQPPVANATSTSSENAGSITVVLTASDADGDALTFTVVDSPTNGTLDTTTPAVSCSATVPSTCTASIVYTHNGSATLSDTFTFKVNDGGIDSATVAVTITVEPTEPTGEFNSVMVLPYLKND